MTEIKHTAGDTVYWLSSKGFTKGYIRDIQFRQQLINSEVETELCYYLTNDKYSKQYQGDKTQEHLVFTSYESMLEYYSKEKL